MSEETKAADVVATNADEVEIITGDQVEVDGWEVIEPDTVADVAEVDVPATDSGIRQKDPEPDLTSAIPITPLTDFGSATVTHFRGEPVSLGDYFFMAKLSQQDVVSSNKTHHTRLTAEIFESLYSRMSEGMIGELRHNVDLDLLRIKDVSEIVNGGASEYSARSSHVKIGEEMVRYDDPKVVVMYSDDNRKRTYLLARVTKYGRNGKDPVSLKLAHPILFAARAFMDRTHRHGRTQEVIGEFITFDLHEIHAKKILNIVLTDEEMAIATCVYPDLVIRNHEDIPVSNFLPK